MHNCKFTAGTPINFLRCVVKTHHFIKLKKLVGVHLHIQFFNASFNSSTPWYLKMDWYEKGIYMVQTVLIV